MNTIDYLRDADMLFFDTIAYKRRFEYLSLKDEKDIGPLVFCVAKLPGELAFTLNTLTNLQFNYGINADLVFTGKEGPALPDKRRTVVWTIDQGLNVSVPWPFSGDDLEFHSVKGSFRTALTELTMPKKVLCDGSVRPFLLALDLEGKGNSFTADGNSGIVGLSSTFTLQSLAAHASVATRHSPLGKYQCTRRWMRHRCGYRR